LENLKKNKAVISLGTNLGNKELNLKKAISMLEVNCQVLKKSKIYITEPWGYSSVNEFLNMGLLITTKYNSSGLLNHIKNIENNMGRKVNPQNGYMDRLIDLDILLFNNEKSTSSELTIPHPRIAERNFSIVILQDIFQENKVPVFNKSASILLNNCKDTSKVTIFENQL
tara:strand:- start:1891 stop:2400 length:510 start_codon:yes stop_codon:yes gene_type:complete